MKAVITCAIALAVFCAAASTAKAQGCDIEGQIQLCGFVWDDVNGNGIQDDDTDGIPDNGDQSGLSDINVSLFAWNSATNQWDLVTSVTTTDGLFSISTLEPLVGLFKVVVTSPDGTQPTAFNVGDDLTDSDGLNDAGGAAVEVCLGTVACPASANNPPVSSLDVDFGFKTSTKVSPGTGTPGYWKNHPEAWAAAGGSVTIGGVPYTWETAHDLMGKVAKDKTYSLFSQLVAAKLNQGIGNEDSCIADTIDAADAWMAIHSVGSGVTASSTAWQQISKVHSDLDDYNNGRLCAPHRN